MAMLACRPIYRTLSSVGGKIFSSYSVKSTNLFPLQTVSRTLRKGFASQVRSGVVQQVESKHGTQSGTYKTVLTSVELGDLGRGVF